MGRYLPELLGTFWLVFGDIAGAKKLGFSIKAMISRFCFSACFTWHMQIIALKNAYKNGFSISSRSSR